MTAATLHSPRFGCAATPEPITWRGHTASYYEHERQTLRELATAHPDEAALLHEIKARFDATIVPDTVERRLYAGAEGRWDERRNTSLVRQTHTWDEVKDEVAAYSARIDVDQGEQMEIAS